MAFCCTGRTILPVQTLSSKSTQGPRCRIRTGCVSLNSEGRHSQWPKDLSQSSRPSLERGHILLEFLMVVPQTLKEENTLVYEKNMLYLVPWDMTRCIPKPSARSNCLST